MVRSSLKYAIYPLFVGFFCTLYIYMGFNLPEGEHFENSGKLTLLAFAFMGLCIALEFIFPYDASWNKYGKAEVHDVMHMFLAIIPGEVIAKNIIVGFSPKLQEFTLINPESYSHLPLLLTVIIGIICYDFSYYWFHRTLHTIPFLWRFHRFHHASEKVILTRGFRFSIVEIFLEMLVLTSIIVLVGIPYNALIVMNALFIPINMLHHANIDVKYPHWMDVILVTPFNHRIHHSLDKKFGNSNYSGFTLLWDKLFGTYVSPEQFVRGPTGIREPRRPKNFLEQYFYFLVK